MPVSVLGVFVYIGKVWMVYVKENQNILIQNHICAKKTWVVYMVVFLSKLVFHVKNNVQNLCPGYAQNAPESI